MQLNEVGKRWFSTTAVCLSLVCGQVQFVKDAVSQDGCAIQGAPQAFVRAVCSADADLLLEESQTTDPATYSRHVRSDGSDIRWWLLRLYHGDRSLGENLPWQKLESPAVRASVVLVIARLMRDGLVRESAAPLVRFAESNSKPSANLNARKASLMVFGLLKITSKIPILERRASIAPDVLERAGAISALGAMCDPRADAALVRLKDTLPKMESDWVRKVIETSPASCASKPRYID